MGDVASSFGGGKEYTRPVAADPGSAAEGDYVRFAQTLRDRFSVAYPPTRRPAPEQDPSPGRFFPRCLLLHRLCQPGDLPGPGPRGEPRSGPGVAHQPDDRGAARHRGPFLLPDHLRLPVGPVSYTHLRAHETRHDLV